MNQPFRRRLSLCLAISLSSAYLAGCGQLPSQTFTDVPTTQQSRTASALKSPQQLATTFAAQLKAKGIESRVMGSVVTLESENGVTPSYDFSMTAKTNKVVFRAGEVVSEIDYPTNERILPVAILLLSTKMIWSGASAWYWYVRTHEGENFSKEELTKAIVYGMVRGGVSGLPLGFLLNRLTPIVWKWVTGEAPIHPTLRDYFELMKKDLQRIGEILAGAGETSADSAL